MDNIGFLQCLGTMRTIFEAISSAASSLMEMNAMNVSPTQEERAQLQAAFDELRDQLHQLKTESQGKIQEYNARKEESAIASEAAIQEYTRMQESLIQLEKVNGEAKVALAQKSAEKDEIQRACRKSEEDLADIRRRRDEEMRKSRKKKEDLKKWFWVPGYGIYLAIDTLVNELDNEIGSLSRRLEEERRRLSDLSEQYERICREVEERNQKIEMTRARMTDQNRQMEQQNATISMYKKQLLYWEDFHMQISRLESRFRAGESSPDMMYEVIELMEAFEDAAEE
ncbi:MAG: hypothetical protein HFH80_10675 [Lachnospiraceae bacterium]|nr:hypothetical protein [Lachnospiraceae bacterium]